MTKSISLNLIGKLKEKISKAGEATRRWERIRKTRVEAKALEGIEFRALPEGKEYLQLPFGDFSTESENEVRANVPAYLLLGGNEEFSKELRAEQLAFFDLISLAAQLAGFDTEIKKLTLHDQEEPVIHALLKPVKKIQELIGQRFEDQKALPPASLEFEKIFDFSWDKTDLVAVKSRN